MGKGADIRFLDDVLGFSIITHDAPGKAIETLIVHLHDGPERVAVLRSRPCHDLQISSVAPARIRTHHAACHAMSPQLNIWMAFRSKGSQIKGIVLKLTFRVMAVSVWLPGWPLGPAERMSAWCLR